MARADYEYRVENRELIITDIDLGRMSVTNCIEEVIEEICKTMQQTPEHFYRIVYLDSDEIWTGFDYETKKFYPVDQDIMKQI